MLSKQVIINLTESFKGNTSVYYDDLKGNIIAINENNQVNAASCIKLFIMIELFNQITSGNIERQDMIKYCNKHYTTGSGVLRYMSQGIKLPVIDIATLMIIISDNIATNILIDLLGVDNINKTIKEIGLTNTKLFSMFDETKESDIFSVTTAKEYALAWKLLITEQLFNKEITKEIIEIFKNNKYKEMIGDGIIDNYLSNFVNFVATKSGKYNSVRNDGGIVSTTFGNYVASIFVYEFPDKDNENDEYAYSIGRKISKILLQQYLIK